MLAIVRQKGADGSDPTTPRGGDAVGTSGLPSSRDANHRGMTNNIPVGSHPEFHPYPITDDRIAQWFSDSGYHFFVDSDGDLGGLWHHRVFYFLTVAPTNYILIVRGLWNREASVDHAGTLLHACNRWNAERLWPKCYLRVRDDGLVTIYADLSIDVEHGATDAQLDQILQTGLYSATAFFDQLDKDFPDPIRAQGNG